MSRAPSKKLKKEIYSRDLGMCRYCGTNVKEGHYHYDHVIAYISGGPTSLENLVLACDDCNWKKNDATWIPIPIGQNWGKDQSFRESSAKKYNSNSQIRQTFEVKRVIEKKKTRHGRTCMVCQKNGSKKNPVIGRMSTKIWYHQSCLDMARLIDALDKAFPKHT